jgi:biopolymer transport protein ExbB
MTIDPRILKSRTAAAAMLFLASLALPATAAGDWWDKAWTARKKVKIDTTAEGVALDAPTGATPVLFRLFEGNFGFLEAKEDGSDIRFVAADGATVLPHSIERFDSLMSEAFVWVKLPDVKPGEAAEVWVYYGNPAAERADDPKGVFDAETVVAYHFGEKGTPPADASPAGNTALTAGVASDGSMIAGGLRLDGTSEVKIPASPTLAMAAGAPMTWSAWVKASSLKAAAPIFSRKEGTDGVVVGMDNGVPYLEITSGGAAQRTPAGAPVAANAWVHLAFVAEPAKTTLYLNGAAYGVVTAGLPALNSPAVIGGADAAGAPGFVGELDELLVSKVARPASYLKLAAVGQSGEGGAKLLVFDAAEAGGKKGGDSHSGYFEIILSSLTFDGWVVIVICAIMAVISWVVMIAKVGYLNRTTAGNAAFMRQWRELAGNLTALDEGDPDAVKSMGGAAQGKHLRELQRSTIYHIYHQGVEEIRKRISLISPDAGSRKLSARTLAAIRSTLDTELVQEQQKLNKMMVLLTIAISGGPFLGLLGTVVGVMITFAAVAAAGDVNVNAIAPGIAAALLATVAGLAVAIPALFGYNYLVTRIKDAVTDMHVFNDEFISKMAEFYGGAND